MKENVQRRMNESKNYLGDLSSKLVSENEKQITLIHENVKIDSPRNIVNIFKDYYKGLPVRSHVRGSGKIETNRN